MRGASHWGEGGRERVKRRTQGCGGGSDPDVLLRLCILNCICLWGVPTQPSNILITNNPTLTAMLSDFGRFPTSC